MNKIDSTIWLPVKRTIQFVIGSIFDIFALPVFIVVCALKRFRKKRVPPAIFIGLMHSNNLVYVADAMRERGYRVSYIPWIIPKHEKGIIKYDMDIEQKWPRLYRNWFGSRFLLYCFDLWAIHNFDVFLMPYLNRLLDRTTFLKWFEFYFLKLANKKVILNPYGRDVATPRLKWENNNKGFVTLFDGWIKDPSRNKTNEQYVAKNRLFCEKNADSIVAAIDALDYVKRVDHIFQLRCIDLKAFKPNYIQEDREVLKLIHAPNHRLLKGTEELIQAVNSINREKKRIELNIVENTSHQRLLEQISLCDIVADQFLIGAYARLAIEAMALGKPVLCYLRQDLIELHAHWQESPMINTSVASIEDKLNFFINLSLEQRIEIGKNSRRFVEKFHSYDYIASKFEDIIEGLQVDHQKRISKLKPTFVLKEAQKMESMQTKLKN